MSSALHSSLGQYNCTLSMAKIVRLCKLQPGRLGHLREKLQLHSYGFCILISCGVLQNRWRQSKNLSKGHAHAPRDTEVLLGDSGLPRGACRSSSCTQKILRWRMCESFCHTGAGGSHWQDLGPSIAFGMARSAICFSSKTAIYFAHIPLFFKETCKG